MSSIRYVRIPAIIIVFSLLLGCTNEVDLDDLEYRGHLYHYNGKPFTGTGISYYDSKELASKVHFENGVPLGNSVSYGYDGETIHEGITSLISIDNIPELKPFVERALLTSFTEGNSDTIRYISVITKKPLNKEDILVVATLIRTKLLSDQKILNGHGIDRFFISDNDLAGSEDQYDSKDSLHTN